MAHLRVHGLNELSETLTERRLNRALLARQLLLERSRLQLPDVLRQIGGLQTQDVDEEASHLAAFQAA